MAEDEETAQYELLLARHLGFDEQLRLRTRNPRTAAQRQFQEVAWGKADPITDHEKAYIYHLKKIGRLQPQVARPITESDIDRYPAGCHPYPFDVGKKWDDARSSPEFDDYEPY